MIRANGFEINTRISGNQSGEAVIFINGIGANLTLWEAVLPYFEKYKVVTYDLRGSGRLNFDKRSGPLSAKLWAEDLGALMNALGIECAHLVGWSLGGMISTELCLLSPKKVKSLIHVGSTPKLLPEAAALFKERAELAEKEGMKVLLDKTFAMTEASFAPSVRSQHPEKVRKFRAMLESHNKDGYAATARALAEVDQTSYLSKILVPTLILVGEYDARTPISDSELMCLKIPDSYMKIIPECGHFYPIEQPEALSKIILEYLARFGN